MGIRARRALISTHATRGTYAWNNPALHARVFAKTLLYSKCLTASLRRRVSTSWHALLHLSELENRVSNHLQLPSALEAENVVITMPK
jgi:hypothetical protein